MKHLTREEVLQEIRAGNWTLKGLSDRYGLSRDSMKRTLTELGIRSEDRKPAGGNDTVKGLSRDSMKSALNNLGISLKESEQEPEPIIMDKSPASLESEWYELYNDYDYEGAIGTQAQFMIAQCRIVYGMTVAQARQYMEDNFHYQIMKIRLSK